MSLNLTEFWYFVIYIYIIRIYTDFAKQWLERKGKQIFKKKLTKSLSMQSQNHLIWAVILFRKWSLL